MAEKKYSSLPSGFKGDSKSKKLSYSASGNSLFSQGGMPSTATILSVFAILISVVSLLMIMTAPKGLTVEDRYALAQVAQDLREIQQKEIVMTSPLKTTVVIEESFPLSDIIPKSATFTVDETIPLDSQVTATTNTGQVVSLNIIDDLRVRGEIPLGSTEMKNQQVRINKELPIDTRFSATLKVNAVYGNELNDIINKLETISQND